MDGQITPITPVAQDKNPLDAVYATRRANLRLLVNEHGTGKLGQAVGYTNGSYISQLLGGERPFTEVAARNMETKLALSWGWLDMQRAG